MYLRCYDKIKDGKRHRYWSILEKRRDASGRLVERRVLHLGEINDIQRAAWEKCIAAFDEEQGEQTQPDDPAAHPAWSTRSGPLPASGFRGREGAVDANGPASRGDKNGRASAHAEWLLPARGAEGR
jgi:hypothetical protein